MVSVSRKGNLLILLFFLGFCCVLAPVSAQQADAAAYPKIARLDLQDPLFSQLAEDIAASRRAFARGEQLPPLVFYSYTVGKEEDLLTIAARTNLGAETIATANGILHVKDVSPGMMLILPNIPGIFVAAEAREDLERMISALRQAELEAGQRVVVHLGESREYVFLPGESFHPVERAYFLGILFRFPLREGSISSAFGMRMHPLTGAASFHSGIDIAAAAGSDVLAARGGTVTAKGYDGTGLGNYVVVSHAGGYSTLYGHLSTIAVTLNQEVNSGSLLGTVGSTGLSTGPHLHFEVRAQGGFRDPVPLIYGNME